MAIVNLVDLEIKVLSLAQELVLYGTSEFGLHGCHEFFGGGGSTPR
jgi:hypothetical protein